MQGDPRRAAMQPPGNAMQEPLIREGAKKEGCMKSLCKRAMPPDMPMKKKAGVFCGGVCGIIFLLMLLLQTFLYYWGMSFKCGPNHLDNYDFPAGGKEELVDQEIILDVDHNSWMGWKAMVYPAKNGQKSLDAMSGTIWRTWGPFWNTYAYTDSSNHVTFMARDRPLSIGGSHWLMRCDSSAGVKNSTFVYNQGGQYFMNKLYYLWGLVSGSTGPSSTYNIWEGGYWTGTKVASVDRTGGLGHESTPGLIFHMIGHDSGFASGQLIGRNHHGHKQWAVKNDKQGLSQKDRVPYWVPTMITSMFAIQQSAKFGEKLPVHTAPSFLINLGNDSVAPSVVLLPVASPPETAANQTLLP